MLSVGPHVDEAQQARAADLTEQASRLCTCHTEQTLELLSSNKLQHWPVSVYWREPVKISRVTKVAGFPHRRVKQLLVTLWKSQAGATSPKCLL